MSIFSSGLTALNAAKLGISTTGHNIANVNTAGFRRQEIVQTTSTPVQTGAGFIGQGTNVDSIRRVYDEFMERQVAQNESQAAYYDQYLQGVQQLDNVMGDRSAGLSTSLQKFFQSWNDLSSYPTSPAARQSVLGAAQTVANSISTTGAYIQTLQDSADTQIQGMVSQINGYARSIASMNERISQVQSNGQTPNDLLDQRDQMVSDLSQLTKVTVLKEASTGNYNIYMGTSYQLVAGVNANTITAAASTYDSSRIEVYDAGGTTQLTASALSSGKLGAVLDYRSNVLDMAQNSLGRIAMSLAQSVNDQHQLGEDLNGNAGGLFFKDILTSSSLVPPKVFSNSNNDALADAVVKADVTDTSLLTNSDYELSLSGGVYTLNRLSDGVSWTSNVSAAAVATLADQGFTLDDSAAPAVAGDKFLIRPTAAAATNLSVAITNQSEIAAADASAGAGATLDNRNALAIAALQTNKDLIARQGLVGTNSGVTIESGYALLVGDIGNITAETKVNSQAQNSLLDQARRAQQSSSGVNLDEEAANLIRYQQAYQAAAQIIKTASTMFDTLLSIGV